MRGPETWKARSTLRDALILPGYSRWPSVPAPATVIILTGRITSRGGGSSFLPQDTALEARTSEMHKTVGNVRILYMDPLPPHEVDLIKLEKLRNTTPYLYSFSRAITKISGIGLNAETRGQRSEVSKKRMEMLCSFTDLALEINPSLSDLKDAEQTKKGIRIISKT